MTTITTPTITMHAGGTGEREQAISNITIPDLWHVAQYLYDIGGTERDGDPSRHLYSKMVLDCWHLAHDMKDHLQAMDAPESGPCSRCERIAAILKDF
jgi:hypothetical protein